MRACCERAEGSRVAGLVETELLAGLIEPAPVRVVWRLHRLDHLVPADVETLVGARGESLVQGEEALVRVDRLFKKFADLLIVAVLALAARVVGLEREQPPEGLEEHLLVHGVRDGGGVRGADVVGVGELLDHVGLAGLQDVAQVREGQLDVLQARERAADVRDCHAESDHVVVALSGERERERESERERRV